MIVAKESAANTTTINSRKVSDSSGCESMYMANTPYAVPDKNVKNLRTIVYQYSLRMLVLFRVEVSMC